MRIGVDKRAQPTVVIIDDDQDNTRLLETILQEEAHCQTRASPSGASLLEHLEEILQSSPALFLVDYTLPGINGLALCKRLRTHEETKTIPMILVTGSACSAVLNEAEQQAIPVIWKPYDLDELLEVVEQKTTALEPSL